MIDTLIDIADLQIGRARLQPADAAVQVLLDTASIGFAASVRSRGGRFAVVVAPTLPERVRCDEARVGRVVRALLEATARAFERPYVRLEVSMAAGARLRLVVRCERIPDAGTAAPVGLPQTDDLNGTHVRTPRSPRDAAATLGLLLIEDLVDMLDGTLTVRESHPDRLQVEALLPVMPAHGTHAG